MPYKPTDTCKYCPTRNVADNGFCQSVVGRRIYKCYRLQKYASYDPRYPHDRADTHLISKKKSLLGTSSLQQRVQPQAQPLERP